METLKVRGNSGKRSEIDIKELSSKKIIGKIEVVNNKYRIRLTRWYILDQEYDNINEATSCLMKIIKKLNTIKNH